MEEKVPTNFFSEINLALQAFQMNQHFNRFAFKIKGPLIRYVNACVFD